MTKYLTNKIYKNWGKNLIFQPERYYRIEDEAELIDIISEAKNTGKKIRIVGTGHSWSDLIKTDDFLINTDKFNKVLHLDRENQIITVQPGIKLWQLNEHLDEHGFAFENLGSIAEQSLAGAIASGTHGTGIGFKMLADQLHSFTIIDGTGVKKKFNKGDVDFDKAVVHLGALGVVSEICLKVVPSFQLHESQELMDFDFVCDNLEEVVSSADHVKFWWFPPVNKILVYRYQRTQEAPNDSRFRQWFMDEFISVYAYRFLVFLGNINANWRPALNSLIMNYFIQPVDRIEKSYKVYNVPSPPIHNETEWAFDVKKGGALLRAYRAMILAKGHKINFLQEIRFTKGDSFALSPSYKRDSIWVGAYLIGNKGWKSLLSDFEELAKKLEGRPHWGKEFTADTDYLKNAYPEWIEFEQIKNQHDSNGLFENELLKKLFASIK